jgi:hypothetical protein
MHISNRLVAVLPQHLPGGTEGNHEKPLSGSWCSSQELNRAPPEYEPRTLLLHQSIQLYSHVVH